MLLRQSNLILAIFAIGAVASYVLLWEVETLRSYLYTLSVSSCFIYFYFSKKSISTFVFSLPVVFVFLALFSLNFDFSDIPFISGLVNIKISQKTITVYFLGVFCLYLGWNLGRALGKNVEFTKVRFRLGSSKLFLWGLYYFFCIINFYSMIEVGGFPLFDIALRWKLDPKLVFIGGLQIYIIPFILYRYRNASQYNTYLFFILIISSVSLTLLGARNPLFKLIVLVTMFNVLIGKWNVNTILKYGFTLGLSLYLLIGIYTKAGIYNVDISFKMIMAILSMDSLGTLYNFEKIVTMTPNTGYFHGQLLSESILKMIPGVTDVRYANQHIGIYLGYGDTKSIGETVVYAQISLSPTMFGVAYADFGFLGVIISILILSISLGFLHRGIGQLKVFSCFFSILGMILMYSTYGGFYGADLLYGIFFCLLFILLNLLAIGMKKKNKIISRR